MNAQANWRGAHCRCLERVNKSAVLKLLKISLSGSRVRKKQVNFIKTRFPASTVNAKQPRHYVGAFFISEF